MDSLSALSPTQLYIVIAGSLGLLLALAFVLRKKPRTKITVGVSATPLAPAPTPQVEGVSSGWWNALSKSRARFGFGRQNEINGLKENFEEACLASDLGVTNTQEALGKIDWQQISALSGDSQLASAKLELSKIFSTWLMPAENGSAQEWPLKKAEPTVIWFVGVNGVGKTTSIAKLAGELKSRGHSVMLAAADTFRAAAGEQLETWAQRLQIDCIKAPTGADSSALLFDAIQSAKSKKIDFLLCDSAGRLHNQSQLMDALGKNKRVMDKALPGAPHEVLLVLDANTGQNMLSQAEHFLSSVGVTGLVLTKLDGTARGGAVVAVARKTALPVRRLGLGESVDDFRVFEAEAFSKALIGIEEQRSA